MKKIIKTLSFLILLAIISITQSLSSKVKSNSRGGQSGSKLSAPMRQIVPKTFIRDGAGKIIGHGPESYVFINGRIVETIATPGYVNTPPSSLTLKSQQVGKSGSTPSVSMSSDKYVQRVKDLGILVDGNNLVKDTQLVEKPPITGTVPTSFKYDRLGRRTAPGPESYVFVDGKIVDTITTSGYKKTPIINAAKNAYQALPNVSGKLSFAANYVGGKLNSAASYAKNSAIDFSNSFQKKLTKKKEPVEY